MVVFDALVGVSTTTSIRPTQQDYKANYELPPRQLGLLAHGPLITN
jgi:hypothetical protein